MSRAPAPLVVFGSINQDIVLAVEEFPLPGQTVAAAASNRHIGGKGANQAVAAALAGAETLMIGAVGQDGGGAQALRTLAESGVNVERVAEVHSSATGTAHICVRPDGENTIVVDLGANHLLRSTPVNGEPLERAAWCLLSLEVPEEEALGYARMAKRRGVRTAVNISPRISAAITPEAVDVVIANESEIRAAVGADWESRGNLAGKLGIEAVIVTQGSRGARVDLLDGTSSQVESPQVRLRDTTGCGDAFAGVLMSRLCRGTGYVEAARDAAFHAGFVAQHDGASVSYREAFAQVAAASAG